MFREAKFVKRGHTFECLEVCVYDKAPNRSNPFSALVIPRLYIRVQNPQYEDWQVYFRARPCTSITLINEELFKVHSYLQERNWRGRVKDYNLIVTSVL